jgi:hypothetical protein
VENQKHGTVGLGDAVLRNGRQERFSSPGTSRPSRSRAYIYQPPVLGVEPVTGPAPDPTVARRRARIANDPDFAEILNALTGEISWQRLRFAFEKIRSLAGGSDNALVKQGYATQEELKRFKANIEDPRHSGVDAVHGVPRGPLKGAKIGESDGFDFVVRLLNEYVDKNPSQTPIKRKTERELIEQWIWIAEGPIRARCQNLAVTLRSQCIGRVWLPCRASKSFQDLWQSGDTIAECPRAIGGHGTNQAPH